MRLEFGPPRERLLQQIHRFLDVEITGTKIPQKTSIRAEFLLPWCQFAQFAPGMKSIDDALELRGRIFGAFELAELFAAQGRDVDHLLTFVVVGAGPTGVEMAGQIAELARYVQSRVLNQFGVILQPEPVLVGVQL